MALSENLKHTDREFLPRGSSGTNAFDCLPFDGRARRRHRYTRIGLYPQKMLAQKQEHRVPAIRVIAGRDRGI